MHLQKVGFCEAVLGTIYHFCETGWVISKNLLGGYGQVKETRKLCNSPYIFSTLKPCDFFSVCMSFFVAYLQLKIVFKNPQQAFDLAPRLADLSLWYTKNVCVYPYEIYYKVSSK